MAAGEVDELFRSLDDGAPFGRPCNRGATPASELEQSLVADLFPWGTPMDARIAVTLRVRQDDD